MTHASLTARLVSCLILPVALAPIGAPADESVPRATEGAEPRADAEALWLPRVFGSGMVMQQGQPLPVWGRSTPHDTIQVSLGNSLAEARADAGGRWKLELPARTQGGPFQMVVRGTAAQRTYDDVLVGEVWLCSGQSNMELPVKDALDPRAEIAAAAHPRIRLFQVPNQVAKQPQDDCPGDWMTCSPSTIGEFSAVAYYFGRELHRRLDVPIGLIDASWGGSLCEAWMSHESLAANPDFKPVMQRALGDNIGKGCGMYNAMIHPLIPYAIRGVIWYQGESNASRAWQYETLFPALIRDWRSRWGRGDFPFYYVQIAPLDRHDDEWVELWDAQRKTLSVPNTGMAVITDLEQPGLHPLDKQDVGKRLSLWALAKDYGSSELVHSGPLYRTMRILGPTVLITFDHAAGLASRDGRPLTDFTIAGSDRRFHPAVATVQGEAVLVGSAAVPDPVAVRFGWTDTAQPNLVNGAGLPASSFRTDDWPGITFGRR